MANRAFAPLSAERKQAFAVETWRYLRIALVVLVVGLVVAVGYQLFHSECKCFLTSISAYYYAPVHAYFVGALVSIGVCLFCLKGSSEGEDVLLDVAGMLAPVVALVPTPDEDASAAVLFTTKDITASVTNNITALLAVGAIGLIVAAVLHRRDRPLLALIGYAVAVALFVTTLLWLVIDRPSFVHDAHFIAASLMFTCISGVVWVNAIGYRSKKGAPPVRNPYFPIAVAMVASVVAMLIAERAGWDYWLLGLEFALIGLFALFWLIQTVELWDEGLR
jgi:hypothetical protein